MTSLRNIGIIVASSLLTLIVVFAFMYSMMLTDATVTNSVNAIVVISSFCEIGTATTANNFGIVPAGTGVATANLVIANTVGNAAGNVLVDGSNWVYLSNTFGNALTLWNPTSAGVGVGNAVKLDPNYVNTLISLPLNSGFTVYNNIYFGVSVPTGQQPGTYAQNIVFRNSCNSGTPSAETNVIFTLTVPNVCGILLFNSITLTTALNSISFGSINPGANTPYASNQVVDENAGGNTAANILVAGSLWTAGANNFYSTNTVFNPSNVLTTLLTPQQPSPPVLNGNGLPLGAANVVDTAIQIPYPPTSGQNSIYFGLYIPPGQASGTYSQNIIIENQC